jgi:hypothetical protein
VNEINGVWGHRMGRTISRLIIAQALIACLLPLSAWAKLSQCQKLLLGEESTEERPSYLIASVQLGTSPKKGRPMGITKAILESKGLDAKSSDNTLLWLIRGTSNVDSLPRERDIQAGKIEVSFPIKLKDGSAYKITFTYEQSNPEVGKRFAVLSEVEIHDSMGFKIKVDPELKDAKELYDLIYEVAHGPFGKIYALEVGDTIIPFKSHISPDELERYKDFFATFFNQKTYNNWFSKGGPRTAEDLDNINSMDDLEALVASFEKDFNRQWWYDRIHKKLVGYLVGGIAFGTVIVVGPHIYNMLNTPKEYVVNELVSEKYGQVKLYATDAGDGINQFKLSGHDDSRMKDESTLILKDKNGTEFVFAVQRSAGKSKIRLQLLSTTKPKTELVTENKSEKPSERARE